MLNLLLERHRRIGQEQPITQVESKIAVSLPDKIENSEAFFLVLMIQS